MTEQTKSNVINIDGEEYDQESMSNEQQYLIAQIRDLQNKTNQAKFQLDQFQVGLNFFTGKLITSINTKEDNKANKIRTKSGSSFFVLRLFLLTPPPLNN